MPSLAYSERSSAPRVLAADLYPLPTSILSASFNSNGEFAALHEARRTLERAGFSVGRLQAHAPSGILFGSYDIQKWRNLSGPDKAMLHGVLLGDMRNGPLRALLFANAPDVARLAFRSLCEGAA